MGENQPMKIAVSIVIIEYNSLEEIDICIQNLRNIFNTASYEIIISSNSGYNDVQQKSVKIKYPYAQWVFNKKNGGFAYGMNRGLEIAKGEYLIILNSDVKIKTGINEMIDFLKMHREVGAVAPKIFDSEGVLQDSCRSYMNVVSFLGRNIKRLLTRKNIDYNKHFDYEKTQNVDWVIGSFIMVKSEIYKLTNGLDESYFLYVEDMDWCTRIREKGFEIVYFPAATIEYVGSRAARSSMKYAKIFLKSLFIYWKKFGFFCGYPKRQICYY
jgi:GT2 family glycosyltransferase